MWIVGQRVLSQSEPELGVGLVTRQGDGVVEVFFERSALRRRYSEKSAPLKRLMLEKGQRLRKDEDLEFTIESIEEKGGLLLYKGAGFEAWEYEMDPRVEDLGPLEQFFIGQWSSPQAFDLRASAWRLKSLALASNVRGLIGAKLSLLPHQMYIAREMARRARPRALLADEVGLGKTIEAALIFSSLRALGRATRVLILCPDALRHQWLAEMFRRFNVLFSLTSDEFETFASEQLWITSLDFIRADEGRFADALREEWDLVIVDEAHHFRWSPGAPSVEWRALDQIAKRSRGLLLLTATPRQQGLETQFGLLHLVDPDRFADFDAFVAESATFQKASDLARSLDGDFDESLLRNELERLYPQDTGLAEMLGERPVDAKKIQAALVDRHGTGRVLFRNRRERLRGFPKRKMRATQLSPGTHVKEKWLLAFLEALEGEKVLLLCSSKSDVLKLDRYLQKESGLKRALFHEDLELVERDRQAAWFAQPRGAQVLISSEVGGEGRNFQFCHKLVLFDLPHHPDLVEQRIGRLDRIGQGHEIEIYVPWVADSSEEVYFRAYSEGLNCFEESWNGLAAVDEKFRDELKVLADAPANAQRSRRLDEVVAQMKATADSLRREQAESTDYLLDLNSFDPQVGAQIVNEIETRERDGLLRDYMERCWDYFGVEQEDFDEHGAIKVTPASLMFVQTFPELKDEKVVCFSRASALAREDFVFLTQDHPMVEGSLSLLLQQNQGVASVAWVDSLPEGLYFEFSFVLQAVAAPELEIERFLAPSLLRGALNHQGNWQKNLALNEAPKKDLPEEWLQKIRPRLREMTTPLFIRAQTEFEKTAQLKKREAIENAERAFDDEIARLKALAQVNRSISAVEVDALDRRRAQVITAVKESRLRLDSLRMILGGK